jgi:hypothetical protein
MRELGIALTTAIMLVGGVLELTPAGAAAVGPVNVYNSVAGELTLVEQTQIRERDYYYRGRRHCWYATGWHGPGWYWCGYANRRGRGWGGEEGWRNWDRGRWEQRYGR